MAGPRVRKTAEERRAEMREAADAIAVSDGLAAVTVRSLAQRMGVVPGLIAHYVDSMDVLRAETVGRVLTAELEEFRAVVEAETNTPDRLRRLTDLLTRAGREGASALWLDAWSHGLRVSPIAAEVRAHMDAWQAFIQQLIEVAVDAGDVECRDPDATAWHIIAVADGLNAHGLVQYRDREALRRQLAKAIGESLGLPPEDLCS